MGYDKLAEELVKRCLKKGADQAEVYLETSRGLSVEIRNGDIETVQEASTKGVGFRVFKQGRMAFSHCNDFSDASLNNAIAAAVDFAKKTTADENNVLPNDSKSTKISGLYDEKIAKVDMDAKIALLKKAETVALSDRRITKSNGASYGENEGETVVANSHGLLKSYYSGSCYYGVSVVAEKGDQKSPGYEYCSRRFWDDLKSPDELAKKAAKDAYEMLDYRRVKTQKAPVIFHPDVARTLLGGILGAINGERVLQGASFLRDKMNEKIGTDLITIIDDPTLEKGLSSCPFDGEGVSTQKKVIVDKGVLKSFMYNTMAAARAGVESTGHAARGGFDSLPRIGAHNVYIANGKTDPKAIIRSTKRGFLVNGITGYGINPVSGNFSGGAQGFWIENGRIAFPVKGLTIASTAFEMLNNIDRVGNDLDLTRTFTGPTIRFKEMQIGGE